MPQANALFNARDLSGWLHKPVTDEDATVDERVVWGWLRPILDLEQRPAQPSAELTAWAIELGGIAHENPSGLSARDVGPFREQYSAERRDAILREVAAGGAVPAGAPAKPLGSFPPAQCYPDPARPYGYW